MQINKINNNQPLSFQGAIKVPYNGNKEELVSMFEKKFNSHTIQYSASDGMSFFFSKPYQKVEDSAIAFLRRKGMNFVHCFNPDMTCDQFKTFHQLNIFS